MMAHPPLSRPPAASADDPPSLPEVRIDVRVGSGRAVGYDLTRGEFLVGGADGCDLRLPGSHLPPVICRFARTPGGVSLRRLAPAFPILLNGAPVSGTEPVAVGAGDRVAVGPADIVVNLSGRGHLRPSFHPVGQPAAPPIPTSTPPAADQFAALERERAELTRLRGQLAEQASELEADRVAWYRRRQEIEAEVRAAQGGLAAGTAAGTAAADREARLAQRETEVAAREDELRRVRDELTEIRQTLFDQYRERREQVEQMQRVVRGAADTFEQRQTQSSAELDRRQAELAAEAGRLQQYVTAEVDRRTAAMEDEFRRRRLELEAQHDTRLRELDTIAAQRQARFEQQLSDLEPRAAERHAEREHLAAAFRELEARRGELTALKDDLARERTALDAERRWMDERRAEQDRVQSAREAEIDRQHELLQSDRGVVEQERVRLADDLLRLDRWQSNAEDRQLQLDRRAADLDLRMQQLTRDAAELEEHVRLADAEHQRLTAEAERLEKVKADLEARGRQMAERSAQVEAQQATLAVLRAKLDRQEDDLHREAAALAAHRGRLDAAHRDLEERLREAEYLRASLGSSHVTTAEAERALAERQSLLDGTLAELRQQKAHLAAEEERLRRTEQDLDLRSADLAEQTAVLKAKMTQAIDLQQRLEADRAAVAARESTLSESDQARVAFQDQLRRRAEDLAARSRELDTNAAKLADERLALDRYKAELAADRNQAEQLSADAAKRVADREAELTRQAELLAEREVALERQVVRLRETGRSVAAGRKDLAAAKQAWQAEQTAGLDQALAARRELESFRARAVADLKQLREQSPALEDQSKRMMEQLTAARDVLRGQLNELHAYANESRQTLDAVRTELRAEAERLRKREAELEAARAEHRLAVSEFRGQLHDWQAKVGELKTTVARSETRIDQKRAELEAAARKSDETAVELARRMEQLRLDRDDLSERRSQVERHLADMREWYRRKLRDLAAERGAEPVEPPRLLAAGAEPADGEPDPGDRQLGELLRSLELIDADTLETLWSDARRRRRTLRQVLLASGAVTLYQLALIEAGNLDALAVGRFRIIDRVRVTPHEAAFRVSDPTRPGVCVLRVLGEADAQDATRPDEYRQRFAAARSAAHPNLVATLEVLDVAGRPAVVQEAVTGRPGSEWPAVVSLPGVWLKAVTTAVEAVAAAHAAGLTHGRLTADSFLLTADGVIKLTGVGDPPWLYGSAGMFDPLPDADLRALGQVAFLWSQPAAKKRGRPSKGLPEPLLAVVRRLESDVTNPMGDTASGADPYRSAADLLADLRKLADKYPCPPDAWAELVGDADEDERAAKRAG
jgi:chromosome segregation ATPase